MTSRVYRHPLTPADLPEGKMMAIEIGGRSLLLCHTADGWYAVDNICTHAFAKLNEGRLRGVRVICPLHGASFDCRNGKVLGAPATSALTSYPIRFHEGHLEVTIEK
jgi:nitrite reductase/ring-hydroxylating ferredoxin subunit